MAMALIESMGRFQLRKMEDILLLQSVPCCTVVNVCTIACGLKSFPLLF